MNAHNCSNKHFEWAQWKWKSTICHIFDQYIKNTPLLDRIDKRKNIQGSSFENFVFLSRTTIFTISHYPLRPILPRPPHQKSSQIILSHPVTVASVDWENKATKKVMFKAFGQSAAGMYMYMPLVILTSPKIVLTSRIGYSSSIIWIPPNNLACLLDNLGTEFTLVRSK